MPPHTDKRQEERQVPEQVVDTWDGVASELSRAQDTQGTTFLHRGQSCATWDLRPSLLRLFEELNLAGPAAVEVEEVALRDFKRRSRLWLRPQLLPSETASALDWWPLMQHFSTPTRLIDWTHSPWVALYFAAYQHFDHDGAIWTFLPTPLSGKRDEAFQAFAKSPFEAKEDNTFVLDPDIPTERLEAQQGAFTVATSPLLVQDDLPCLRRTVLKASIKQECLFRLRAMNITAASLFPGLDGLGKAVAEGIRLTSWVRTNHNQHMLEVCQNVQRSLEMLKTK